MVDQWLGLRVGDDADARLGHWQGNREVTELQAARQIELCCSGVKNPDFPALVAHFKLQYLCDRSSDFGA
jgi:hypothetical protein